MRRTLLMILGCFILASAASANPSAQGLDMGAVQEVLCEAEALAKGLPDPRQAPVNNRAVLEAKKSADAFASPEYQDKLRTESERLKTEVFSSVMKEYYPEESRKQQPVSGKLAGDERIYMFISSSIPSTTLRSYIAMADKLKEPNLVFVLRGMVGGAKQVGPTMTFVAELLKKDPGCDITADQCDVYQANVQVDPLLFSRFRITQVPTVVYARAVGVADGFGKSEGLSNEVPVGDSFLVEGDAALDRLVEVINRDAKSKTLEQLVVAMRKGYY